MVHAIQRSKAGGRGHRVQTRRSVLICEAGSSYLCLVITMDAVPMCSWKPGFRTEGLQDQHVSIPGDAIERAVLVINLLYDRALNRLLDVPGLLDVGSISVLGLTSRRSSSGAPRKCS